MKKNYELNILFIGESLALILGYEATRESRLLVLSSPEPQSKVIIDEILNRSCSEGFKLRQSEYLDDIHEDTLNPECSLGKISNDCH